MNRFRFSIYVGGACVVAAIFTSLTLVAAAAPADPEIKIEEIVLQQGREGYRGCEDTVLKRGTPDNNFATTAILINRESEGGERGRVLMRFDLTPIPKGVQIVSAHLQLRTESIKLAWGVDPSKSIWVCHAYRVRKPWVVTEATDQVYARGKSWTAAGCGKNRGEGMDRELWPSTEFSLPRTLKVPSEGTNIPPPQPCAPPGGKCVCAGREGVEVKTNDSETWSEQSAAITAVSGCWVTGEITEAVRRWYDGSWLNEGLILINMRDNSEVTWHSVESDQESRPRLVVRYTRSATAAIGNESPSTAAITVPPSLDPPLQSVTGVVAEAAGKRATIRWTLSEEPGVVGYHVYRSMTFRTGTTIDCVGLERLTERPVQSYGFVDEAGGEGFSYGVTAVTARGAESRIESLSPATTRPYAMTPDHPRMLFTKQDLPVLRERYATVLKDDYQKFLAWSDRQAERVLSEQWAVKLAELAKDEKLPREDSDGLEALGVMYHLTGERKYGEAGLRLMRAHLDNKLADYVSVYFAYPSALAYDLYYDVMSPPERIAFGRRILDKAIGSDATANLGDMGYNLDTWFWIFKSAGLLAIYGDGVDDAKVRELLYQQESFIYHRFLPMFRFIGEWRGGWSENPTCGCFTDYHIVFFEFYRNCTGRNVLAEEPVFKGWGNWILYTSWPDNSGLEASTNHQGGGLAVPFTPMALFGSRSRDGVAQHFALSQTFPDIASSSSAFLKRLLEFDPLAPAVRPEELPTTALFRGLGLLPRFRGKVLAIAYQLRPLYLLQGGLGG